MERALGGLEPEEPADVVGKDSERDAGRLGLAALRIRLKGSAGKSLEEMLAAADDEPEATSDPLGEAIGKAEGTRKGSLDDLLANEPKKPEWPS